METVKGIYESQQGRMSCVGVRIRRSQKHKTAFNHT
jgi:hypothetical protein